LIGGKVTYVHRRLWPALVKLAPRFDRERLAKVWDEHTKSGAHVSRQVPFRKWVPADVMKAAETLLIQEAEQALSSVLASEPVKRRRSRSAKIEKSASTNHRVIKT
jgi:hypothetical protein